MPPDATKFLEQKRKLTRRISALCGSIEQDLTVAFDKYFEENSYAYFSFEEKLNSVRTLFESIQNQVAEATRISDLSKIAERVLYVEDRMDEIIAPLYNRRRRKRNSFRFSDFFNKYKEQIGSGAESEVSTLKEAFELLGLSGDETMLKVTAAFRSFAKKYHPDARGGDRSQEIKLRRIVGAYQYIKQNHPDT
ncbi:MAG: DnaJ domain-containing protein [Nitrospirae bacterium]|nr:DnaJ domain-containing protein [Candidatus Troglogloeales bacterium]